MRQQYKNTGEQDPGWLEIIEIWAKEEHLANIKETTSGMTQSNEFHGIENSGVQFIFELHPTYDTYVSEPREYSLFEFTRPTVDTGARFYAVQRSRVTEARYSCYSEHHTSEICHAAYMLCWLSEILKSGGAVWLR